MKNVQGYTFWVVVWRYKSGLLNTSWFPKYVLVSISPGLGDVLGEHSFKCNHLRKPNLKSKKKIFQKYWVEST